MDTNIEIVEMVESDVVLIVEAFHAQGWKHEADEKFQKAYQEHVEGKRTVLVAKEGGEFHGYLTVLWESDYGPFKDNGIPEINRFDVLKDHQRRGIGTLLMDVAEKRIAERSPVAGIGVGMYPAYGPARRLYALRGYIPDGRGLSYDCRHLEWSDEVRVDDSLVLFLTKELRKARS